MALSTGRNNTKKKSSSVFSTVAPAVRAAASLGRGGFLAEESTIEDSMMQPDEAKNGGDDPSLGSEEVLGDEPKQSGTDFKEHVKIHSEGPDHKTGDAMADEDKGAVIVEALTIRKLTNKTAEDPLIQHQEKAVVSDMVFLDDESHKTVGQATADAIKVIEFRKIMATPKHIRNDDGARLVDDLANLETTDVTSSQPAVVPH